MKIFFICILLISMEAQAASKEEFHQVITSLIQQDPAFKEVDLSTPYYQSQVWQGYSRFLLPKVSLSYGRYEQQNSANFIRADDYRVGSLNASFNLFSFGSDWKGLQSSRYEMKAQDQRVMARLLERERTLAVLVLNYLREMKNLSILEKLVEVKEKALDLSRRRFDRGTLSEEDFNKVKLDVSNAKGELLITKQTYNKALAAVKAYGPPHLPADYPWVTELTDELILQLESMSTPVDELPQFREADFAEVASDYRSDSYRNLMLGKVQLNFSRTKYEFETEDQWAWATSVVYTLPLFEGFDQFTEYRRNEAQKKIAIVRKRFEKYDAAALQEAEKSNLQVSWKNWIERRDALKISSRLYTGSLSQFTQGKLSVNELFVDQDRLLRTELIANSALHQLHESILAFCHSRGKAFIRGCF